MKTLRSTFLIVVPGLVYAAVACQHSLPAGSSSTTPPDALTVGPVSYFDERCARCHGPEGSFYGSDFVKNLESTQELHNIVEEMAAGPGMQALKGRNLDAQVAYHLHLASKQPFIAITRRGPDTMEGEVTPGATLSLTADGNTWTVSSMGGAWTLKPEEYAALTRSHRARFTANENGRESILDPFRESYTGELSAKE